MKKKGKGIKIRQVYNGVLYPSRVVIFTTAINSVSHINLWQPLYSLSSPLATRHRRQNNFPPKDKAIPRAEFHCILKLPG